MHRDGRSLGYSPLVAALLSLGAASLTGIGSPLRRAPSADRPAYCAPNSRNRRVRPLRLPAHRGMWRKLQKRSIL